MKSGSLGLLIKMKNLWMKSTVYLWVKAMNWSLKAYTFEEFPKRIECKTVRITKIPIEFKLSLNFYKRWWLDKLFACEKYTSPKTRIHKFLANLMFELGHFAPKSFTQLLHSTIMGVAKWGQDILWLSLVCKGVKWKRKHPNGRNVIPQPQNFKFQCWKRQKKE